VSTLQPVNDNQSSSDFEESKVENLKIKPTILLISCYERQGSVKAADLNKNRQYHVIHAAKKKNWKTLDKIRVVIILSSKPVVSKHPGHEIHQQNCGIDGKYL